LPVALGSVSSVAFMNLNLAYNSVGFYQLSKLLCIPATLAIQSYFFNTSASYRIKQALVIILLGVGIATVSDVQLNLVGSIFAGVAVIATTLAQIYTNTKQQELGLDHMQLLYHTSPLISVFMLMLAPLFDQFTGPTGLFAYEHSAGVLNWIFLTCILAVGVNVTNYLVLGKTSPLTYQVVGHLKTCMILVLGFVVFNYPIVLKNLFGIVVALLGMVWYTELKRRDTQPVAASPQKVESNGYSSVPSEGEGIELDPLDEAD